jgi:biotin carboxylase
MPRLLLLIPTTTYRADDFLSACQKLGVDLAVGSNRRQVLERYSQERTVTLNFRNLKKGTQQIIEYAQRHPLAAIVPVDDETTVLAAQASSALGLPHNPVESVLAARDKHRMREILSKAGLPSPRYWIFPLNGDPVVFATTVSFPCVLKPTFLSASRGVIRANNGSEFISAFHRIEKILKDPEVSSLGGDAARKILVEGFIPGKEIALEGLLIKGDLKVLALFDKPDPLDGPFFEETLYVTPSRKPFPVQKEIAACASRATRAMGMMEGPVHAELRLNDQGPWVIELAARSIGGLCSRTLRFGAGLSLEELIIRHALGLPVESLEREGRAAGVMMIPIPRRGILREVRGKEKAKAVPGIEGITIMIRAGQEVIPLPEGHRYLGFIFARGDSPVEVENALRESHRRLEFVIAAR